MSIEFFKNFILGILIFNFSFWLSIVSKAKKKKKKKKKCWWEYLFTGASRTEHAPRMRGGRIFLLQPLKVPAFFHHG
jgi:hypothetical protein